MSAIVLFEKQGEWARQFGRLGFPYRIVETRSLDDCLCAIRAYPGCLAAVEVDSNSFQLAAEWLWSVRQGHRETAIVVIVPPKCDEMGWCLRQMGAIHVISSTLDLRRSKRLIKRHLGRIRELPLSLEERIWNNLPWRASNAEDIS